MVLQGAGLKWQNRNTHHLPNMAGIAYQVSRSKATQRGWSSTGKIPFYCNCRRGKRREEDYGSFMKICDGQLEGIKKLWQKKMVRVCLEDYSWKDVSDPSRVFSFPLLKQNSFISQMTICSPSVAVTHCSQSPQKGRYLFTYANKVQLVLNQMDFLIYVSKILFYGIYPGTRDRDMNKSV